VHQHHSCLCRLMQNRLRSQLRQSRSRSQSQPDDRNTDNDTATLQPPGPVPVPRPPRALELDLNRTLFLATFRVSHSLPSFLKTPNLKDLLSRIVCQERDRPTVQFCGICRNSGRESRLINGASSSDRKREPFWIELILSQ
jgi:hypothetical protein